MNEDTYILGTVTESHVSRPVLIEGRPKPLYTITVSFDEPGDAYSLGLLYDTFMGPNCLNRVETREQLMHSTDITFESILKPMVTGQNIDTGEFETGTKVKVSCRFEMRDGELGVNGDGEFKFPDFVLRFVDSDWSHESLKPETIPVPDAETMSFYDF